MGKSQRNKKKFTVVSLFSGAMGLDLGLENTGRFKVLAAVEKVPSFCETIRKNVEAGRIGDYELSIYETDISSLDPLKVLSDIGLKPGELDVITGGPPCQSFSTAGKRRTVKDPRGELLWDFLNYVSVMQPKVFLMENVRGLASAAIKHRPIKDRPDKGGPPLSADEEPGSVLKLFLEDLRKKNPFYRIDAFLVNAVNYGAPQLRERLIIIGNRLGLTANFPNPTHGPNGSKDPKQQQLFKDKSNVSKPFRSLGSAIKGLNEKSPVIMDFSERKKKYLSMVPSGSNWRSLPPEIQMESMGRAFYAKGGRSGWWRRLSYDLPCPTLVTMPNHAGTSLCHPEEIRTLTVREYALIQEFPHDWEFFGKPAEQYAQVGNAVPVRLGEISGNVLIELLDKRKEQKKDLTKNKTIPDYTLKYIRAHVRTRKWFKNGDVLVWKDKCKNGKASYGPMKTEYAKREL